MLGSLQLARKVALDHVAYENEHRGVKSLKIPAIRRCNKGTIVYGRVKNPNRTHCKNKLVVLTTELLP